MIVAIFGASGGIGKFAVKHALLKGHQARAFLRNPSKLKTRHENLVIIKGEINCYDDVRKAVDGCDAVIWCIGVPIRMHWHMASLEGHRALIKAMDDCGVKRLIDWNTTSTHFRKDKKSFITVIPGLAAGILVPWAKREVIAIADLVTASDLNWTIVRFVTPTNSPYTGKVKVGFGDVRMKVRISREDIGAFMVEQLSSSAYECSMPIIGS